MGGQSPPAAEAECEVSIQFLTFSCTKCRTVYFANTQFKKKSEDSRGRLNPLTSPPLVTQVADSVCELARHEEYSDKTANHNYIVYGG